MKNSTFPILAFKTTKPNNYIAEREDNGTGFFINGEGVFISAGHVFKKKEYHYFALIDDEIYPIVELFNEYLDQRKQKPYEYKDLYIGRIYLTKRTTPIPLSSNFNIENKLSPIGYSTLFFQRTNSPVISIEDLDYEDDEIEVFDPNPPEKLNWYDSDYFSFTITSDKMIVEINPNDNVSTYENGFTIEMNGNILRGLSGGPVLSKGTVKGILIAENNCISSNYIISKLTENKIKFTDANS